MPPHCDSLDGPVVTAARYALDAGDVDLVLPYVHAEGEAEIREAFDRVAPLRTKGSDVATAREYVEAMLGFEVYSNHVYQALHTDPHGAHAHAH